MTPMAKSPALENGSCLDYLEILQTLQNNGVGLDLDVDSLKVSEGSSTDTKLRDLFDQFLSRFLKEISLSDSMRPLPAMVGDGKCIDLFKLFWVVREKGGYDFVSKCAQWGLVAAEIGLGSIFASSVKLCYFKYLDALDRWIRCFQKEKGRRGRRGIGNCGRNVLPVGLKTQFKEFLSTKSGHNRDEGYELDTGQSENQVHNTSEGIGLTKFPSVDKCVVDDDEKNGKKGEVYSRKRKRETLLGMVTWLTDLAKNTSDAAIVKLGEAYKQKGYGNKEYFHLVLVTRNALCYNQNVYLTEDKENHLSQKKQKMHPSMYEDQMVVDQLFTERQICSPRILAPINGQLDSYHELLELDISKKIPLGVDNYQSLNPFDEVNTRKRVSIGAEFQAEVPEWTGVALESDPKWLGSVHWPLETEGSNLIVWKTPIGKGRQDSCDCRLPGSVECIRFHIAEKKARLKSELGKAFYSWRFHFMGEEVSLSWTEEEEKKFKTTVSLNPRSLDKYFWNPLCRCFRTKGWRSLVSYYFNVFVLRRRMYQNRVTPRSIDSDDDESEFGSVGEGFGIEAVTVPGLRPIVCAQNYQCTHLD